MPLALICCLATFGPVSAAPDAIDGGTRVEAEVVRTGNALTLQLDGGTPSSSATLQPPELLDEVAAPYPPSLIEERVRGTVQLLLQLDEEGHVVEARVSRTDDARLAAAALHAAPNLHFAPALLDGRPVSVWLPFTWTFEPPPRAAPQALLVGQVRSRGTRRPVADALVRARGVETVTDADGRFRLELPPGEGPVEVVAAGHLSDTFEEALTAGQQKEVLYRLTPREVAPYETVVREERERVEVSSVSLREDEVRAVPGTLGDPFRVVMMMPGVASLGSGLAYPVVRGSQPAATGYFLDGVRVPLLFHLLLGPSVVHPDFVEGIDFYPGAPPARFGRQLGGAVEGRVRRPRGDGPHATASVDLLNASALVEVPLPSSGTSVTLAGRFSYSAWLLATAGAFQTQQDSARQPATVAEFGDYQARVEQRLGDWRLRLLAFGASDVAGTRATSSRQLVGQLGSFFHRVDVKAERQVAGGQAEVGLTWGTERLGLYSDEGEVRRGEFSSGQATFAARAGWQRDFDKAVSLRLGADVEHRRAATHILGATSQVGRLPDEGDPLRQPSALGTLAGLYAEATWRPAEALRVTPGLRLDSYHRAGGVQYATVEPRLSVRYQLAESLALKGGAGLFHQAPTMLVPLPMVDVSGLSAGLQEGVQLDVGAEWRTPLGVDLAADAYLNPLLRTEEFSLEKVLENRRRGDLPAPDPSSHGQSYGFELLVRRPLGGSWFGWASYSFNRSVRQLRYTRYDEAGVPLALVQGPATFAFEQAHVLNAAASVQLPSNFTLGAGVHLNTGRPESGELSSRTRRVAGDVTSSWWWVPVERNAVDRLPTFVRLDLRAAWKHAFDDFALEVYADVFNVTFNPEVYGFTYGAQVPVGAQVGIPMRSPLAIPVVLPLVGVKGSY